MPLLSLDNLKRRTGCDQECVEVFQDLCKRLPLPRHVDRLHVVAVVVTRGVAHVPRLVDWSHRAPVEGVSRRLRGCWRLQPPATASAQSSQTTPPKVRQGSDTFSACGCA